MTARILEKSRYLVLLAVLSSARLTAVAALGVVGHSVALIYTLFGAPDLAMIWRVVLGGVVILVGAFGLFELELLAGASVAAARTVAVNAVIMVEIFYLLNCRSLTHSMFRIGVLSNRWVIVGNAARALLQLLFTYAPFMNTVLQSAPIGAASWGHRWGRLCRLSARGTGEVAAPAECVKRRSPWNQSL